MFIRLVGFAFPVILLGACSRAPQVKGTEEEFQSLWTFHFEGMFQQEVSLLFTLDRERLSFQSVSCRNRGGTLDLDPLEGVGEIRLPAAVLAQGMTLRCLLAPGRSDPVNGRALPASLTLEVGLQLDAAPGAWIPAARISLPGASLERTGHGYAPRVLFPAQPPFASEILFLSLFGGDFRGVKYLRVEAVTRGT